MKLREPETAGKDKVIDIERFLALAEAFPVIDVRSPEEYRKGHIPGAFSLPLFSDKERAVVGTLYHKRGRQEAVTEAYSIVGPKLNDYVLLAEKVAPGKRILIYCWRGGMRSTSVGFLLETAGFEVSLLKNGYKAYRNFVLAGFEVDRPIIILGGKTGSGKTGILRCLAEKGEQVTDLEGMANHKGSIFGGIGQETQPASEQFSNNLGSQWQLLDKRKVLWLEDESYQIGKVSLPGAVFRKIRESALVRIDIPVEVRADRLAAEYGAENKEELAVAIRSIEKRIGGLRARQALEALNTGDYYQVAIIALEYYDKAYEYSSKRRLPEKVYSIRSNTTDFRENADLLMDFFAENREKIFGHE